MVTNATKLRRSGHHRLDGEASKPHTKVVSEPLGHANISVTLDIYSKVRPAMDAHAAETVAADLFAPRAAEQ